jgi:hypothetical protein
MPTSSDVIPRGEDGLHTYAVIHLDSWKGGWRWVELKRARTIQEVRKEAVAAAPLSTVKVQRATESLVKLAERMAADQARRLAAGKY